MKSAVQPSRSRMFISLPVSCTGTPPTHANTHTHDTCTHTHTLFLFVHKVCGCIRLFAQMDGSVGGSEEGRSRGGGK
jgi:hypothetical protein